MQDSAGPCPAPDHSAGLITSPPVLVHTKAALDPLTCSVYTALLEMGFDVDNDSGDTATQIFKRQMDPLTKEEREEFLRAGRRTL